MTSSAMNSSSRGTGAPFNNGYTKIYSAAYAFAALKADGSITAWGSSNEGGANPLPLSILRNVTENFERPALTDHVILVGAPNVLYPPTKAADL
jgi:hypothetical protein